MATETFYIRDLNLSANETLCYDRSPEAASATTNPDATALSGWTVAKLAAPRYARLINGSTQTTFSTSILYPDATALDPVTVGGVDYEYNVLIDIDCIGFSVPWNGYFPAGTWTFTFPVIAQSAGGAQDGRIAIRVLKSSSNGVTVTELTSARLVGTTVTNLATTAAQNSVVTWSAPAFYLNQEILFIKIGWEITGAGGANNAGVRLRRGVSSTLVTPSFRRRIYNMT